MADEEKIFERIEKVRRLFLLTDEEFVQEVLQKNRSKDAAPPANIREQYDVSDHTLMGRRWYKIRAKDVPIKGKTEKILYLHGGAYVLETGIAEYIYAGYLSEQTGAEIWFPEYHLAPEYSCTEAVEMVTGLYRMMLKETQSNAIAMMGASAGGGLAVSSAMHFREKSLPQPNSLILYSPGIEFTLPKTDEEKEYLEILGQRDTMISYLSLPTIGRLWRGELDEDDYRANPIRGNLCGLAPMTVFAGTGEVLNLAARHFVEAAKAQQIEIAYYEREMMPHCWVLFPDSDNEAERKIVIDQLVNANK